ncbi:hypothetical protein BO99DRAFT_337865, partial [Aspergillus violaceofuscus CBS 115571]
LDTLPAELILSIADFLRPHERALLSLCNKHPRAVMSRPSFASPTCVSRTGFLALFARNLPEHVHCTSCSSLHLRESIDPPASLTHPQNLDGKHGLLLDDSSWALSLNGALHTVVYRFRLIHLQLAMKRYYDGPEHGVTTEWLSYIQVNRDSTTAGTRLFSADAEILPGPRLCLRIQTWVLGELDCIRTPRFPFCNHLFVNDMRDADILVKDNRGPNYILHRYPRPVYYRCPVCAMDFEARIIPCGNDGDAFIVTMWLDLGSGLVDDEEQWYRHVNGPVLWTWDHHTLRPQGRGTTAMAHERSRRFTYQDLTRRNCHLLHRQEYEQQMNQVVEQEWILQHNYRVPYLKTNLEGCSTQ